MMAIGDLLVFGQKLKIHHIIGIISVVVCGSLISLSQNKGDQISYLDEAILPVWVAVLISALAGCFFTVHSLFMKHLC